MKTLLLLSTQLFINLVYTQGVITIQHGSSTKIEKRLDSAVAHAQSGDVIYLPGGLIISNGITINKKISIIGAGYRDDSSAATGSTIMQDGITLDPGSEGSLITGVFSTSDINIYASNITLTRCNFQQLGISTDRLSLVVIEENIIGNIRGWSQSYTLSDILVKKNIVNGSIDDFLNGGGITFSNNIFISAYRIASDHLLKNNIFLTTNGVFPNSSQFKNNLFVTSFPNSGIHSGNVSNEPVANIFLNYTSGSSWNTTQNFHLKSVCKGIGLGTDGTDAGIYGTLTPFKDGGIPFNPHYQSAVISNSTDSIGKLKIDITVKAQNN